MEEKIAYQSYERARDIQVRLSEQHPQAPQIQNKCVGTTKSSQVNTKDYYLHVCYICFLAAFFTKRFIFLVH